MESNATWTFVEDTDPGHVHHIHIYRDSHFDINVLLDSLVSVQFTLAMHRETNATI